MPFYLTFFPLCIYMDMKRHKYAINNDELLGTIWKQWKKKKEKDVWGQAKGMKIWLNLESS
jgi:hypothetical protein